MFNREFLMKILVTATMRRWFWHVFHDLLVVFGASFGWFW